MDLWRLQILLLASLSRAESGDANCSFRNVITSVVQFGRVSVSLTALNQPK